MLKNYFLVAIRHLKRQPAYAFLNIFGLTIGIVSALLITLYLNQELGYDKQHEKAKNIYRISSAITEPDNNFKWSSTQAPLGRTVKEEFSEVVQYTRFAGAGNVRMRLNDVSYFAEDLYLVDSTVFDVFTTSLNMTVPVVTSLCQKFFKHH